MKVSSCKRSVAPPKTAMIAKLSQWIVATRPLRQRKYAIWMTDAAIATAVAT